VSRRIITPEEDARQTGRAMPGYDPTEPVTRGEVDEILLQIQANANFLSTQINQLSIRIAAIVGFFVLRKRRGFGESQFDLSEFYEYAASWARRVAPAIETIVKGNKTILDRLAVAGRWNEGNPDLALQADDLYLHQLATDPEYHMVTPDEVDAVAAFPATDFFRREWTERTLPANEKIWLAKLESDRQS
jgi:hypothetical protein